MSGNVWHGTQEPWHNWDILSGRFVSEFGMLETFLLSFLSVVEITITHTGKAFRVSKRLITGWAATSLNDSRSPGLFRFEIRRTRTDVDAMIRTCSHHNKAAGFERRLEVISFRSGVELSIHGK